MNNQIFLDHFERLTDVPNAAARLRELVLQLAVQGKLVAQDERDEPAAHLLERIKAERKRLVREKKIKETKPLSPVSEDEKPFEIPSHRDQCPFTGSCSKSTQMKLAKTQHGFDNPEYGLDRALALRIDRAACHGG